MDKTKTGKNHHLFKEIDLTDETIKAIKARSGDYLTSEAEAELRAALSGLSLIPLTALFDVLRPSAQYPKLYSRCRSRLLMRKHGLPSGPALFKAAIEEFEPSSDAPADSSPDA